MRDESQAKFVVYCFCCDIFERVTSVQTNAIHPIKPILYLHFIGTVEFFDLIYYWCIALLPLFFAVCAPVPSKLLQCYLNLWKHRKNIEIKKADYVLLEKSFNWFHLLCPYLVNELGFRHRHSDCYAILGPLIDWHSQISSRHLQPIFELFENSRLYFFPNKKKVDNIHVSSKISFQFH